MTDPGCIVLVVSTTSYRAGAFLEAGRKLGVEVLVASDRCHVLDRYWTWPADALVVDFYAPEEAARIIAGAGPVAAVVPAEGEAAALVAAMASRALRLPANAQLDAYHRGRKQSLTDEPPAENGPAS